MSSNHIIGGHSINALSQADPHQVAFIQDESNRSVETNSNEILNNINQPSTPPPKHPENVEDEGISTLLPSAISINSNNEAVSSSKLASRVKYDNAEDVTWQSEFTNMGQAAECQKCLELLMKLQEQTQRAKRHQNLAKYVQQLRAKLKLKDKELAEKQIAIKQLLAEKQTPALQYPNANTANAELKQQLQNCIIRVRELELENGRLISQLKNRQLVIKLKSEQSSTKSKQQLIKETQQSIKSNQQSSNKPNSNRLQTLQPQIKETTANESRRAQIWQLMEQKLQKMKIQKMINQYKILELNKYISVLSQSIHRQRLKYQKAKVKAPQNIPDHSGLLIPHNYQHHPDRELRK